MCFSGRFVKAEAGLVEFDCFNLGRIGRKKNLPLNITSPCN
jgi:hypothetical protein